MKKLAPLILLILAGCAKDNPVPNYQTEKVIIIVIDGPRLEEAFGDPLRELIPVQHAATAHSTVCMDVTNSGNTYTTPGHVSMLTGYNEDVANDGTELPLHPSIFQRWREFRSAPPDQAWIITTKDKLEVLANCQDPVYKDDHMPNTWCGTSGAGIGSGYGEDSATLAQALLILDAYSPTLALISFKDPDHSAHTATSFQQYTDAIARTDSITGILMDFIDTHPDYAGRTTVIVTNDHGRHSDGIHNGYLGHGDDCAGCRQVYVMAYGPDFNQGFSTLSSYDLIDIPNTIGELLGMPRFGNGDVMWDLFRNPPPYED